MEREKILERLESIQERHGYLKEDELLKLGRRLGIPLSEVYGTASFYSFLETEPKGDHIVRVCENLPCRLEGSRDLVDTIRSITGIDPGETSDDGKFSLETTSCLGRCDEAPAMMVDGKVYTDLTEEKVESILEGIE